MSLLEINNLKSHFFTKRGVVPAVDGVDIRVETAQTVGVVGESGCGKSMTAMSVMRLLQRPGRIVGGEILFNGTDLTRATDAQMRKIRGNKISMIFQEPMTSLNPVYTVGRQVSEAIILHEGLSKAAAKERVLKVFDDVGIPEPDRRYSSYPHQLSGGLRQRVMIGMAMVCRPKLMIADEPTTALDVTIEAQILRLMRALQEEHGTSIMLITHNLGVVAELCDYVYVMYAGRIMEAANVFDLFEKEAHPYTRGLLRSIPRPDGRRERLYTIKGMVPNLLRLPKGCRFYPRCDNAKPICSETEPELSDIGGGHYIRCHEFSGAKEAGAWE